MLLGKGRKACLHLPSLYEGRCILGTMSFLVLILFPGTFELPIVNSWPSWDTSYSNTLTTVPRCLSSVTYWAISKLKMTFWECKERHCIRTKYLLICLLSKHCFPFSACRHYLLTKGVSSQSLFSLLFPPRSLIFMGMSADTGGTALHFPSGKLLPTPF